MLEVRFSKTDLLKQILIGWEPQVILSFSIISEKANLKCLKNIRLHLTRAKKKTTGGSVHIQSHPQRCQSAGSQYG